MSREPPLAGLHATCPWQGEDEDARSVFPCGGRKALRRAAGCGQYLQPKRTLSSSRGATGRPVRMAAKPELLLQWEKQIGLQYMHCSFHNWLQIKCWGLKIETTEPEPTIVTQKIFVLCIAKQFLDSFQWRVPSILSLLSRYFYFTLPLLFSYL